MDCEKFEPLLIDELYGELDEITSAALKRHVAGCARCSGILQGLSATRRTVALPEIDLPPGLEDRIFAATREAQKVTPIRSRASHALSLAGSWAMRPQTAMAAVFLLMIGSSAFLLRAKREAAQDGAVSVTVAGEPAASNAAADHDSLDDKAASAAHGATTPSRPAVVAAAPQPAATVTAPGAAGPIDEALGGAERAGGGAYAEGALGSSLPAEAITKDEPAQEKKKGDAPEPPPMAARVATQSAAPRADEAQDNFSNGMASYRSRNFAEATAQFDQAARGGDANAALWAAKSVRDGSGCAAALGRLEAVAAKAAGTWTGNEALFEAAQCQVTLGQSDGARAKFTRLLSVASHEARAKAALSELESVASRSAGPGAGPGAGGGAGRATPKAAAAPPPAKPAATIPAER